MLLIFRLGRPDVLPTSDYGVRKGFALTFCAKPKPTDPLDSTMLTTDEKYRRAKKWPPWRSSPAGTSGAPAILPPKP